MPSSGDSPLGSRKRSGSSGEESTMRVNAVDNSADLDLLKQELLHEIRKEMNKVKQEIIEGNYRLATNLLICYHHYFFCSYSTGIESAMSSASEFF